MVRAKVMAMPTFPDMSLAARRERVRLRHAIRNAEGELSRVFHSGEKMRAVRQKIQKLREKLAVLEAK
jgi:hypothetical protein